MNNQESPSIGKKIYPVLVRFSTKEKERLDLLVEQSEHATISQFVRKQCLNPAIEMQLALILRKLEEFEKGNKLERSGKWRKNI
jgi:hypothetical protein